MFSARSRESSICSAVTTFAPGPLSLPASEAFSQLRRVCVDIPNSRDTALRPCPSLTRCTAASLNSAVYTWCGTLNIYAFLPLGRVYTRPAGRRNFRGSSLLQHVSRVVYRDKPLYYGRDGTNRYDAPTRNYGVLYLGRDLPTGLMESVFHKHQWDKDTKRSIAQAEVQSRLVRAVGVLEELHLADLTAEGVMAGYFGLNLEQLASRDYTYTQQVSAQVHALLGKDGLPLFDGVL
ncbi:hypothetical protein Bxe_C0740 [Paraburkholderia xenovorans LB400]|uniref:RES domain-containing protein n=1 Tax=Paraburkholderia xenovorans (strain LB400) TaxID=266265 RepID=Q13H03_PARXL|nr:hypothetical protein Bxe_C0740 [Paraburkholderia xenovorans LB400]